MVMAPISSTHKQIGPTDPTTNGEASGRVLEVWEGYAVQADEAGTSQAKRENTLMGWGWGKTLNPWVFLTDVIYCIFFSWKKLFVICFLKFWIDCNVDVWVKSTWSWICFAYVLGVVFKCLRVHFRRSMYDFRFGIQMANVVLWDFLPQVLAIKNLGPASKGSFQHISTN